MAEEIREIVIEIRVESNKQTYQTRIEQTGDMSMALYEATKFLMDTDSRVYD